ncbi:unnamed protein product [Notodromas monacha]|uniref:SCP2 domain-containing protein n=1 Tax=Notodromas monacha TaxID=399045 RepID=A0A7R9BNN8_9CRUS|nr:unnamed protein product [Notodromas monacha]CAG0917334.1 unnamed protein product [Notodromas monacha]
MGVRKLPDVSGLAQCAELCWQLRGEADKRQVPGAVVGLQHNIGLGGAVVVALYQLGFPASKNSAKMAVEDEPKAEEFAANKVFTEITKALEEEGEKYVKKIRGKFLFKVRNRNGKEGYWLVNCKDGNGSVTFGKGSADCTLVLDDADLVDLMMGKGKLKVQGNLGLAMKLESLQKESASRLSTIRAKL